MSSANDTRTRPPHQEAGCEKVVKRRLSRSAAPTELTLQECAVLICFPEVAHLLGRKPDRTSRIYLWRLQRRSAFPSALQISPNRIAWRRDSVLEWMASRPTVRYAKDGR